MYLLRIRKALNDQPKLGSMLEQTHINSVKLSTTRSGEQFSTDSPWL
jgi:hypothetical protein